MKCLIKLSILFILCLYTIANEKYKKKLSTKQTNNNYPDKRVEFLTSKVDNILNRMNINKENLSANVIIILF